MEEFDLPPVRDVCLWALETSCIVAAGSFILLLMVAASGIMQGSVVGDDNDGYYLVEQAAEDAEAAVLLQYLLWCGVQGALAAGLALALTPGTAARRALAAVAATATAATYWKVVRCIHMALVAWGLQRFNGGLAIIATAFAATVLLNFAGLVLEDDDDHED